MFDITPEVDIPQKYTMHYLAGRIVLYVFFAMIIGYAFIKIAFPNYYGYFDFSQYYGAENTLIEPRLENGEITRGFLPLGSELYFNAVARGEFNRMEWKFRVKESENLGGTLELIRAYRATLYPTGDPIVLREGSLVRYEEDFFIFSGGALRMISRDFLEDLGFSEEQFMTVSEKEFNLHNMGNPVEEGEYWIEGALFREGEEYYQWREGRMDEFVSERAYLSRYREADARILDRAIANSDASRSIGFADGMLLAYGDGVFVTDGEFTRPIVSPEAFVSKGYKWDWVIEVTDEEFSAYERGDIYTLERPHADGTVFQDVRTGTLIIVEGGQKHPIVGEAIRSQYDAIQPVETDLDPDPISCEITSRSWGWHGCDMDIQGIGSGAEYQFVYQGEEERNFEEMYLVLVRGVSMESFRVFLSDIKQRLLNRW